MPSVADTSSGQGDVRLGKVLQTYAVAQDKVGKARLAQDSAINNNFVKPWSTTLNTQIAAATKARQNVKSARLSLDAARAKYKTALAGQKQEQARLDVEAAEETLVNATEEAINLMRTMLDNVCFPTLQAALAYDQHSVISLNL
ncbi:BAR domain-containing protein [Cystobasidiomycetes sp. EMM_F5]